jgi:hypothetical protein
MVLFQFLEVIELFGNYLRVEYLCHAFIMPSTKRNGISATSCGDVWICTRVHGAPAFCARELLVENYGKDLANPNRSTPLSESRARNLSSPVFVVWQQYGCRKLPQDTFLSH